MGRLSAIIAAASLSVASHAPAQAAKTPCDQNASYHALDFWIGDWDVYDTTGKKYAHQKVHAAVDGCAIVAEWTGPVGDRGLSVLAFDPAERVWHQMYVANQVPYLTPFIIRRAVTGYTGKGLQFARESGRSGATRDRITVAPLAGGRVRELLEASKDGGKTWAVIFDAEHRRAAR